MPHQSIAQLSQILLYNQTHQKTILLKIDSSINECLDTSANNTIQQEKQMNAKGSDANANNEKKKRGKRRKQIPKQQKQADPVMDLEIIQPSWTAKEELLLLELIEKHGFRNWKAIRSRMGFKHIKKSEQEIQRHYSTCYLQNPQFLPLFLDQKGKPNQYIDSTKHINISSPSPSSIPNQQESTTTNFGDIDVFFSTKIDLALLGAPDKWFIFNYYNKRHQFVEEYDPHAQKMLSELQFNDEDSQAEMGRKMELIRQYNARLSIRNTVKDVGIEHRLLESGYQRLMKILKSQEEAEAFKQFIYLAKYMRLGEFAELIGNITLLRKVRKIIVGLQRVVSVSEVHDLTATTKRHIRQCFKKFPPRNKVAYNDPQLAEKKLELMIRQLMNVNKKNAQKIISLVKEKKYKTIKRQFKQTQITFNTQQLE